MTKGMTESWYIEAVFWGGLLSGFVIGWIGRGFYDV